MNCVFHFPSRLPQCLHVRVLVAGSGSRPQSSCAKQLGMEQGEYPFAGSCPKQLGMEQSVYPIAGGESSCAKQLGMEQGEYPF